MFNLVENELFYEESCSTPRKDIDLSEEDMVIEETPLRSEKNIMRIETCKRTKNKSKTLLPIPLEESSEKISLIDKNKTEKKSKPL